MIFTAYNNTSDTNVINKSIEKVNSFNCKLKENCSIKNPKLILENQGVPLFNYGYIDDFKRFYYVKEVTSITKNIWEIDLEVDVLESFKSGILSNVAILDRQENLYNLYLNDEYMEVSTDTFTIDKRIGNKAFRGNNAVLSVAGFVGN